jgi:peptidoglycan/LPS O-acetylase OafA/YrhL
MASATRPISFWRDAAPQARLLSPTTIAHKITAAEVVKFAAHSWRVKSRTRLSQERPAHAGNMTSGFRNIRALDGIRGLAIILVMFHHFDYLIPPCNTAVISMKLMISFGWVGVDLFFALSGFLITGILLDTRKANNYFSAFYARRVLRIFPLYYSVLIVILAAAALWSHRPSVVPLVADQKLYFLYLTNWLVLWKGQWDTNILGHFWSLAVEEQFYLIWPLCVWLLISQRLAKVAVGASVVALLARILWVGHTGTSQAIVMATVTRMDTLLCGALGAILFRQAQTLRVLRPWLPRIALAATLMFIAGVGLVRVTHGPGGGLLFIETFGFTLLAVGFAALVLYAAATDGEATLFQRTLCNGVLTDFGKYSYGIYVYHVPMLFLCDFLVYKLLPRALVVNFWFSAIYVAFLFVGNFFIAKVSYECFERHFLALKRYFEPGTSEMSPVAAGAGVQLAD